jgi:thiamine biosynthesis protein ThiS
VTQIQLMVNGEARTIAAPATLENLLTGLQLDPRMVVVELNREIIRRPQLGSIQLKSGDSVELVHFVGGG